MAFNYEINQLELMQARIKSVPHGWQFTYVGKAFCIRNNLRKPISEEERSMSPGNYPYYGPTKIQGYIGTFEQDGSYALIGEDGDHFLKFEKHSMTQLVDGKCTVNNHAHIIEGTKEASREWFYYYFMHRDIFSFLSRQGAGRYKLNKASLEKMPLLLPPIVEQKKIAQILSTWDKAISVTEKLLANSQQQKKAL
ncbi:restriction endonuclease subunit S, partial [Escherichia coli]|nr:restriction endonuclease subunit S [Escherichia coli]HAW8209922.1 restriction endonuclease subunit S [Escherichia coli]